MFGNSTMCVQDLEMELEQTEGLPRNGYAGEDYITHDPVQGLVLVISGDSSVALIGACYRCTCQSSPLPM